MTDDELHQLASIRRGGGHPWSETETNRISLLAKAVVARHIQVVLADIECFCTPNRPELERRYACVVHLILDRLDINKLAAGTLVDAGLFGNEP